MSEYTVVFDSIGYRSSDELALMESGGPAYRPRVSFADKGDTVELDDSEAERLLDLGAIVEGAGATVPDGWTPPPITDPAGKDPTVPATGNEFAEAQAIFHQAMLQSGVSAEEAYRRAYGAMEDAGSLPEGVEAPEAQPPSEGSSYDQLMALTKAELVARAEAAGIEGAEAMTKAELADALSTE
jgi:hypothetical protein